MFKRKALLKSKILVLPMNVLAIPAKELPKYREYDDFPSLDCTLFEMLYFSSDSNLF